MKRFRTIAGTCMIVVLGIAMAGCPQQKSIADLTSDPSRYMDKDVAISGSVTNSFGALGQGVFEIDDGTGRMWVYTEKFGVPSRGVKVVVSGRLKTGVHFMGRNYGTVLHETDRRKVR